MVNLAQYRTSERIMRVSLLGSSAFVLCVACGQSNSERTAVKLSATVTEVPPSLTLHWEPLTGSTSFVIYRKSPQTTTWGTAVAQLGGAANQWTDSDVVVGEPYDYKVVRSASGTGHGYIRSGIRVAAQEDRGALVLLVAEDVADQLAAEVLQLEQDLWSDGWWVLRQDVALSADPASVRQSIMDIWQSVPGLSTVYVLGHVPVPYTGNINPDGHAEHRGAWPCDAFYGELTSTWTDATVNSTTGAYAWNSNVPGDGKFDQSDLPSAVELMVGRVDLTDLPSYSAGAIQLTADYLAKARRWKLKEHTVPATAVLFDDLQWTGYPLAQSGHMALSACVGASAVSEVGTAQGPLINTLSGPAQLWSYHCSTGAQAIGTQGQITFTGTQSGINTQQVANADIRSIFNISFGSYFGDWDNEDNFLRALLGSGDALAHVWSSIPNWYLYPMAMGETIGFCTRMSQNNTQQVHSPQNAGWQGQSMARTHMALMGDPTLRQVQVAPPSQLVVSRTGWYTHFNWEPSQEAVAGYVIHRVDSTTRSFVRVGPELITGTTFASSEFFVPGQRYLVRAVQLITGNTGSFYALSMGAMADAQGAAVTDCAGVVGGSALPGSPCDDGDPATLNDLLDEYCNCMGTAFNSVNELEGQASLSLVQAPGMVSISADRPLDTQYRVLSPHGAVVHSGAMRGDQLTISTTSYAAGSYLLVLGPGTGTARGATLRFVVTH